MLGCGATTGLGAVLNTAKVEPGTTVAVFGCGGIGLNCIQGASLAGARRIIAVDMVPSKLELARQFGANDIVDASAGDPVEFGRAHVRTQVPHAHPVCRLPLAKKKPQK